MPPRHPPFTRIPTIEIAPIDCPHCGGKAHPYQDVKVLIDLRNALTHFNPELESEADQHKEISDKLTSKITPGPFFKLTFNFFRDDGQVIVAPSGQSVARWHLPKNSSDGGDENRYNPE
jgi:hypothetical protein